jgi:hypothetical protein
MPKNTTGGNHKGRKNGEGNTAKKNRTLIEAFISDIQTLYETKNSGFTEFILVSKSHTEKWCGWIRSCGHRYAA